MALVRNGRILIYAAEVAMTTDLLRAEIFRMNDVAKLAQTILGGWPDSGDPATYAAGLNCTPTSPPALAVNVAPGVIYQFEEFDATDYSSVPADTTNFLYKQGINMSDTEIDNLDPPVTPGNSIAYLIQAQFVTTDTEIVARQYYNAPNPPITESDPDVRTDTVSLSVKASTPAASPVIPTPDAGKIGLWVVTVPQGASVVNSGMIALYNGGASFITETLIDKLGAVSLQNSVPIYGADTGSANAYVVTATPVYTSVQNGTIVWMRAANANTGPSTLNLSALGATAIQVQSPMGLIACAGGEILPNVDYQLMRNGSVFQLMNPSVSVFAGYSVRQQTGGQPIANGNTPIQVEFDNTVFNDDTGTITYAAHEFTVHKAGKYDVRAGLSLAYQANTGNSVYGEIYVNGSPVRRLSQTDMSSSDITVTGSATLSLAVNDVVALMAFNATNIDPLDTTSGSTETFLELSYRGN